PKSADDLSSASSRFNDDLISENLAQIMVRQGKNKKAIDIYQRLGEKHPEKKAYFAARIRDLKKDSSK
ncbi:MAG: hypothetical protein WBA12_04915, partial [Catalinimonas sp.]